MRNKVIITHPSEDHASGSWVDWAGRWDSGIDAIWIDEDGVVVAQPKGATEERISRWRGSKDHLIPKWMSVPHHGRRADILAADEEPPKAAKRFLDLIPLKSREHLVGDLEEIYKKDVRERGVHEAQRRYWKQVLLSFIPIVWTMIKEAAGLAVLLRLIK